MTLLDKSYWDNRYKEGSIGWDIGHISTPLKEYIDQLDDKSLKILIPGCGNAYEAEYFFQNGFKNVTIVDISETALDNVQKRVTYFPKSQLINQDFFEFEDTFDLILEQTFFCALDPILRKEYAKKMHSLLSPKGKLVGLLFDFPLSIEGPPFGGSKKEYLTYFEPYFQIEILEECNNSIPPRAGRELFFKFQKR